MQKKDGDLLSEKGETVRSKAVTTHVYTTVPSLVITIYKNGQIYERSALNKEQSQRLAQKIEAAMKDDKLYLDASISLQKLAKHITAPPNYISQTLNETIGMNFFDYVNHYRIEAAKPMIIDGSQTVLTIAMAVGFNARSSFYTAFKKETQQTPSAYKKSNSPSKNI